MTILKVDILNEALEELRIRGITVDPTPEEHDLALRRLEAMAAQWDARTIRAGYLFEDEPDPNTEAGIDIAHQSAFALNLAVRLVPAFNKQVPIELKDLARGALSDLSRATFVPKRTNWPTRHPVGSGNLRSGRWRRFYPVMCDGPDDPRAILRHDEQVFGIQWHSELSGEDITASSWTASSTALTILDDTVFTDNETQVKVQRNGTAPQEVLLTNTVDTANRSGLKAFLIVCLE